MASVESGAVHSFCFSCNLLLPWLIYVQDTSVVEKKNDMEKTSDLTPPMPLQHAKLKWNHWIIQGRELPVSLYFQEIKFELSSLCSVMFWIQDSVCIKFSNEVQDSETLS